MGKMEKNKEESEIKDWAPGEWCEVCHNGGNILYGCDRCPRIYHPKCYMPVLLQEPPENWICIMCTTMDEIKKLSNNPKEGSDGSGQMGERELQICRRLLLEMCNSWPESCTFQSVKSLNFKAYRQIIQQPIALDLIKQRLGITHQDQYTCIRKFVDDVHQMFANCRKFWESNKDGEVYLKHASNLEGVFDTQLEEWQQIVYHDSDFDEDSSEQDTRTKLEQLKDDFDTSTHLDDDTIPELPISKTSIKREKSITSANTKERTHKEKQISVDRPKHTEVPHKIDMRKTDSKTSNDIKVEIFASPRNTSKRQKGIDDKRMVEKDRKANVLKLKNKKKIIDEKLKETTNDEKLKEESDNEKLSDSSKNEELEHSEDEESSKKRRLLEPPKEENLQQCKYCDAVYADIKGLKSHTLKHFEDKIWSLLPKTRPFKCPDKPFCTEEFKEKITLMRHYAFEHYMYLKDLSTTIGKPLTKSRYTVLVNNNKIHPKVSSGNSSSETVTKDLNSNLIGKMEVKSARVLGLRSNLPQQKNIKKSINSNGRRKRSCAAEDKNYQDLSEQNIKDLQKVEGVDKDQVQKFYQDIKETQNFFEEEACEGENLNSGESSEELIGDNGNETKSEEEMEEHEMADFTAFAELPLC